MTGPKLPPELLNPILRASTALLARSTAAVGLIVDGDVDLEKLHEFCGQIAPMAPEFQALSVGLEAAMDHFGVAALEDAAESGRSADA